MVQRIQGREGQLSHTNTTRIQKHPTAPRKVEVTRPLILEVGVVAEMQKVQENPDAICAKYLQMCNILVLDAFFAQFCTYLNNFCLFLPFLQLFGTFLRIV